VERSLLSKYAKQLREKIEREGGLESHQLKMYEIERKKREGRVSLFRLPDAKK
jgi:hypothetical protein